MWELPAQLRGERTVLACIQVSGPSAFDDLNYRRADAGEPDGDALVCLPSGLFVEIREYRTTIRPDTFSVTRYGDVDPALALQEFLGVFGLPPEAVTWSECDAERWQVRYRDEASRTYLGAVFGNLEAAHACADDVNRRADGWTATVVSLGTPSV